MTETQHDWTPALFCSAMDDEGMTSQALADALRAYGWFYSVHAVRSWRRPESPGPKHPGLREALAEILPTFTE